MKVFITWSGEQSKQIALALYDFIPKLLQVVEPFMSAKSVDKGTQWQASIMGELEASKMGIICLTPDNLQAPWILFEAGALAKKNDPNADARVYTYLHKLTDAQVLSPLTIFQHTLANKEDTLALMQSIRRQTGARNPSDQDLTDMFNERWPKFQERLDQVVPNAPAPKRPVEDMVSEVLGLVRELARTSGGARSSLRSELLDNYKASLWFAQNYPGMKDVKNLSELLVLLSPAHIEPPKDDGGMKESEY